jgi:hypothetical protein
MESSFFEIFLVIKLFMGAVIKSKRFNMINIIDKNLTYYPLYWQETIN